MKGEVESRSKGALARFLSDYDERFPEPYLGSVYKDTTRTILSRCTTNGTAYYDGPCQVYSEKGEA